MLGFIASSLTPMGLFVVLNVVIWTIFITSSFKAHNKPHEQQHPQNTHELNSTQPVRTPSLLERVRSIDFSFYRSEYPNQQPEDDDRSPPQLVRAPSLLERVRSFNFSLSRSDRPDPLHPETHHLAGDRPLDDEHEPPQTHDIHVIRSKSDKSGEAAREREAGPERMAKSASENSRMAAAEDEEEVVRRRPATVRERKQTTSFGEDDGVDAKADDFINRFKQQLKLQRLDSLLRYREMLNRGSSK